MKKLGLLLALLGVVTVLALPIKAAADVNAFTVTNFDADETLSKDDPQGSLHIIEHIDVDFFDYNHGILRAIPQRYKHHSLQLHVNGVSSATGSQIQYSTYNSNGNTVLKIGDPDRTITGAQSYTIDYTIHNVIASYDDHDELYWNVNGNQWQQVFTNTSVTLHVPANLIQTKQPICYTGTYKSTSQNCKITANQDGFTIATTNPLYVGETLTYVAAFQKNYFQAFSWRDSLAEYAKPLAEIFIPILMLSGAGFIFWLRRGRDAKGTGIIVPQYDAPDGLKPIDIGTIADFKVDNRDITATIIDLAVQRYIKIIESKKDRKLRKDVTTYSLELTNDGLDALSSTEHKLLSALFDNNLALGRQVDLSKKKNDLSTTAKTVRDDTLKALTEQGYFTMDPTKAGQPMFVVGGIIFILIWLGAFKLFGGYSWIGLTLGGIIAVLFGLHASARTAKGVVANEHIQGLKLYLNTAEKKRLQKLQAPKAAYAANAGEPIKTVELFEKLLPYAVALNVEQGWAKQFEALYVNPPDWYSGNWTTFNAFYLANSLNSGLANSLNQSFSPPSSSTSSGFGGGGFSGGGGGGGGGGGW